VGGDFGGGPFASSVNEIPLVDPGSISGGAHGGVCSSGGFGSAGDGPNCPHPAGTPAPTGTWLNIFANLATAQTDFRQPLIGVDGRDGSGHPVRGLGAWNLDSQLGKVTTFHERYKVEVSADFFNIFNHVNYFDPTLNVNSPGTFGVISSELIPANRVQGSRWIQLGLRVSF
jgi:hypothetical protein